MCYNINSMSGIIRTKNWLRREVLLCAFMSLCVLITFFVLNPQLSEFAEKHAPSPISISNCCQDYVVVSVASIVRINLRRINYVKDNIYSKIVSTYGACRASQTCLQFVVNLYWNIARLCSLAGISEMRLHRACELLDMPPPSNTLSF
jgi:hypothetical protein